jgi:hypothetical protein
MSAEKNRSNGAPFCNCAKKFPEEPNVVGFDGRIFLLELLYEVIECESQISCRSNRKLRRNQFLSIFAGGERGQDC